MAFSRVQLPPSVRRGDAFEVRITFRHPMETGFRVDEVGKSIPRNVIRDFVCRYNGVVVFRASLGSGIAANPYLKFPVVAGDSGELQFAWVDDTGETGDARAEVKVG